MKELKQQEHYLLEYDIAVDALAECFIKKYFGKEFTFEDDDCCWIGSQDSDRETLCINDYYFNIDRIVDALRYSASSKKLFEYYDMEVNSAFKEENIEINFRNFLKTNEKRK